MVNKMDADIKRTKNGEPLPGTVALEDLIDQLHNRADQLRHNAQLLEVLQDELPADLSPRAQAALALLATKGQ